MSDDRTRPLPLPTGDGLRLEGELAVPSDPWAAAVVTHPHPLHGGSMRSIVTSELFRRLPEAGVAACRFNFRGVEGSEGEHGGGVDEALDVEAAVEALAAEVPGVAVAVCGWSFGADVALRVTDARLCGWFLVAPTLRIVPADEMAAATDPRPKLLAVPEHDQFRPPGPASEATASWSNTRIEVVAGADHFLVGRTSRVAELAVGFLREAAAPGGS